MAKPEELAQAADLLGTELLARLLNTSQDDAAVLKQAGVTFKAEAAAKADSTKKGDGAEDEDEAEDMPALVRKAVADAMKEYTAAQKSLTDAVAAAVADTSRAASIQQLQQLLTQQNAALTQIREALKASDASGQTLSTEISAIRKSLAVLLGDEPAKSKDAGTDKASGISLELLQQFVSKQTGDAAGTGFGDFIQFATSGPALPNTSS